MTGDGELLTPQDQARSARPAGPRLAGAAKTAAAAAGGVANLLGGSLLVVVTGAADLVAWVGVAVLTGVGAMLGAGTAALVLAHNAARYRRLEQLLQGASQGNLQGAIDSRARDALGEVERAADRAMQHLSTVLGTLQHSLVGFHADRLSVAAVNREMLDSAEDTAGHAYDVGVSAGKVSDNVNIVASSTEELASTVNEIARHATFAADIALAAAEQGQIADDGMRDLAVAVQQVEALAQVISGIAGQTHLLALNATIEASRAGQAGLGFAVVAKEVKELSRATSEATEQVRNTLQVIQHVSARAAEAIHQIGGTLGRVSENSSTIAAAVMEQGATTREIMRVSEMAAREAAEISERVAAVHLRTREIAYIGASNDATKSKNLEVFEDMFRAAVAGFAVGPLAPASDTPEEETVDQQALNERGTSTADGVTSLMDYVQGSGLDELDYTGTWLHGDGLPGDVAGDAYSCVPGDQVTLRFVGRGLRFYGYADQGQGMAEVSLDGGPLEIVDFYSPTRTRTVLWESPSLDARQHTFTLTVAGSKNEHSRYFWVSVAKLEIVR